jgi:ABC-type phosphate/phosphonate transport system permease subunit
VLGFVGVGGLGQRIHIANQLLTLILTICLMVAPLDALLGWLRRRVT